MTGPRHVLVVDDDLDSRTLLQLALSFLGYAVTSATNGQEALVAARQHRPDVILLDLAMPVMDGFAFRSEQLRDPALATIPVICVSGQHDAALAAHRLHIPVCIAKPFDIDDVMARVVGTIGSSHSDPSA